MKISEIVKNLESCIIAFEEGASDEKRMAISVLEEMKEKLDAQVEIAWLEEEKGLL